MLFRARTHIGALEGPRVIERVQALRYVVPLREGGSLPAIVDASDGTQYVVKFRGAGQGPKALVAELLAAGLAGVLGLPVPTTALVEVDEGFGRTEPDPEIQDLLRGSRGTNFGLAYLAGALGFDAAADRLDADLATSIVWFDAYISNVDRTARNPNLLLWDGRVWMIDHGAALYFHHAASEDWLPKAHVPFAPIASHILLDQAGDLDAADARMRPLLTEAAIRGVVDDLPDEWLAGGARSPGEVREAYVAYLLARLDEPRRWLQEASDARRRD